MNYPSFWETLQQPIIGLAPMDGVTDAPCRTMHGLYERPDVVLTEFTNVEGLWRGSDRIYRDFLYTPAERPVVAQIFGCQPEYFYKAAHVVCELGFDGLDIKKGVPQFQAGQYVSRNAASCLSSTRLHSGRKIARHQG
jgi:tRNA-dihydrouridine synthase B